MGRFTFRRGGVTKISPHPGPQSYFVTSPVEDVAFGGARGPGKSWGLLLDAAAREERYGGQFTALMVRKQFKDMQDLIGKAYEVLYPCGARYWKTDHVWVWPSGAKLFMGHLDDESAAGYQGWEVCALYVDELGEFESPDPIDKIWGSMRSPHGIPIVRRATINPGGVGHVWVKQRYLAHPVMKVFKYQPQPLLAPKVWREAVFIPGQLEDNPTLMKNDPDYEARLAMVGGSALYRAWRWGDWDAVAGLYFDCWSDTENIAQRELKPWWPRWIAMDWGFVHPCAVGWFAQDDNGHVHQYREWVAKGNEPEKVAEEIMYRTDEPIDMFILSPDAFARDQSDRTIAIVLQEALAKKHLRGPVRADNRRTVRYGGDTAIEAMKRRMSPIAGDADSMGGWMYMYQEIKARRFTIDPSCVNTVASIKRIVHDPKHPEDALKVNASENYGGDDEAEMVRFALKTRARTGAKPYEVRFKETMTERLGVDPQKADANDVAMLARKVEAELAAGERRVGIRPRYAQGA